MRSLKLCRPSLQSLGQKTVQPFFRRPKGFLHPKRLQSSLAHRSNQIRTLPTAESLSLFLELSLGITAWKAFQGTRWSLRSNPSSGNLHPAEGYVVSRPLPLK